MKSIIKTAQGKRLDMGELSLKNEKINPVGNAVTPKKANTLRNKTVASNTIKNKKRDKKQLQMAQNFPVTESKKEALRLAEQYLEPSDKDTGEVYVKVEQSPLTVATKIETPSPSDKIENVPVSDEIMQEVTKRTIDSVKKHTGGLADAIAKAREVTQEPLKTPRQEQRDTDGVKKI